jgi:chitinase
MKYADLVNLMSYDIGIYPPSASIVEYAVRQAQAPAFRLNPLHVALYSTPEQERSVDFCIQYMLKAGVPPEKIIVGAAFYGKAFSTESDTNDGLYQPGKRVTNAGSLNFKDLGVRLSPDSGWVKHWDNVAMVPYAYNASKKLFVTYEDKRSVDLKAKYVLDHKLGGIMFWQLGGDTYTDGLLNTIDQDKKTYTPAKK